MDEELTPRQVPHSLEAEQAVLGSILIDSRCITDVVGTVKPEDFSPRSVPLALAQVISGGRLLLTDRVGVSA